MVISLSPVISTDSMLFIIAATRGTSRRRSMENTTSSGVNGWPLWKTNPSAMVNLNVVSSTYSQLSATPGAKSKFSSKLIIRSYTWPVATVTLVKLATTASSVLPMAFTATTRLSDAPALCAMTAEPISIAARQATTITTTARVCTGLWMLRLFIV